MVSTPKYLKQTYQFCVLVLFVDNCNMEHESESELKEINNKDDSDRMAMPWNYSLFHGNINKPT